MPTYIILGNLSREGLEHIDESPDRLETAKELTESLGGEFVGYYLTFGEHDFVYIFEAPDDQAAARFALAYGKSGAGETETLKAFTESEYRDLVADVPDWGG